MREVASGGPRSGGRVVVGVGVRMEVCDGEGGVGSERKVVCGVERLVLVCGGGCGRRRGR